MVHLSTYDKAGGAAIAAWRLHEGLRSLGVESRMVVRTKMTPGNDVSPVLSPMFEASDAYHRRRVMPAQPPESTLFTVDPVTVPVNAHPWIAEAEIIHLHWTSRFLGTEEIAALCVPGRTVFWTFHGEWAYTGGCHYIGGPGRTESDWDGTSQIGEEMHAAARSELAKKRRLFGAAPFHVIAPSRWIGEQAAASGLFAPERIHNVPYGLDLAVFRRERAVAENGAVELLFGCQNLTERRKGFRELASALRLCMEDTRFANAVARGAITLKTFGTGKPTDELPAIPLTHLGLTRCEETIAAYYRSASAFLCPTLDDNLPNVVMESLACGCPVLGFATGGVPDMVKDGENGMLAARRDVEGLAGIIKRFCLDATLRETLRAGAAATDLSCWTLEAQARTMLALYQKTLGGDGDGRSFPEAPEAFTVKGGVLPMYASEVAEALVEEMIAREEKLNSDCKELRQRAAALQASVKKSHAARLRSEQRLNKAKSRIRLLEEDLKRARHTRWRRVKAWFRKRLKRISGGNRFSY